MRKPQSILVCIAVWLTLFSGSNAPGETCFAQEARPGAKAQKTAEVADIHEIYGTVRTVEGSRLTIETRAKKLVQVDVAKAKEQNRSIVPVVGRSVLARGTYDKAGVLHADTIQRAKDSPTLWPEDK